MTDTQGYQRFFAELKRRRVFRVMAVYGIVGFVLLQIVDLVVPALLLPEWTYRFVALILLLGFPVALVLAWALEMTPEGVQKTQAAAPGELGAIIAAPASQRLPGGLMALVGVVALVLGAWWVGTQTAAEVGSTADSAPADVRLAFADLADDPRPSIAVLPFDDMSPDGDQTYFSDGMTEEISNVLAKIRGLRVAARTSTFALKDKDLTAPQWGDTLQVAYLIEGSVRKAGDQVRITAQLIDTSDGSHLWTEGYTRPLDDVFQIQAEIAEAVADALTVPLGLENSADLVTATADLEAYDLYLAGRARLRERGESLREAIPLFKAAVARDSMWAPAWAGLAEALELTGWYAEAWDEMPTDSATWDTGRDTLWSAAEVSARRALELDPRNASAHVAMGSLLRNARRWEESEIAYLKALSVDPDSPEAHQQYAEMLLDMGRITEARQAAERAVALDRVAIRIVWQTNCLIADDEVEQAQEILIAGIREFPEFSFLQMNLEQTRALLGQWDEWVDMAPDDSARAQRRRFLEGDLSAMTFAGGSLEALMLLDYPDSAAVKLAEFASSWSPSLIWTPVFDPLRDHPVYLEMLRELNLEGATPRRTPR
jgi:TolB-like protein